MKNNEILIRAALRLLSRHLQITDNADGKFIRFAKFVHSLPRGDGSSFCPENISFALGQNIDSRIMAVVEPFPFHEKYREADQAPVEDLFRKILGSIGLSGENTYVASFLKCGAGKEAREKTGLFREWTLREARIVGPAVMLGFGRNLSRLLFDRDAALYSRDPLQGPGYPFYCLPGPAEVYYEPSLKKDLWDFLKFFRDRHLKNVC